jgi:hypothetical protein
MTALPPGPDPSPDRKRDVERLVPLVPKKPGKGYQRDKLRVDEYFRLLDEGVDPRTAGWTALSDPAIGIRRWRGKPASARPNDVTIERKMASHLLRAAPELVEQAKAATQARFSRLSEKAAQVIDETMSGDFEDPARARVQLDAAKTVTEGVGVGGPRGGPVQNVQVNTAVAVQRDAETEFADRMLDDPEFLREVESIADKVDARRADARRVEGDSGDGGAAPERGPVAPGPAPEPPLA